MPSDYDKNNPFPARMTENRVLNRSGTSKETRLFVINVERSGLSHTPGDSLGVFPSNRASDAADLLEALKSDGCEPVRLPRSGVEVPAFEAFIRHLSLAGPTKKIVQWAADHTANAKEREEAERILALEPPGQREWLDHRWFVDVLRTFPSAPWTPQILVDKMRKLMPRLYSISSSQRMFPNEIHLTVAVIRFEWSGHHRSGVCSSFLADRVDPQRTPVPVFISHSHFGLPKEPDVPLIMVGPGTGIAPFRAFLQDRKVSGDKGKNWLFFGDQHVASDFLYEEELLAYQREGLLTRLDCAWSRDQKQKIYVQDKMREHGKELARWIADGAYFYVCGDAKRMAKDVDTALHDILVEHLSLTTEAAAGYVKAMKKAKRYQRDVY